MSIFQRIRTIALTFIHHFPLEIDAFFGANNEIMIESGNAAEETTQQRSRNARSSTTELGRAFRKHQTNY